MFLRNDGVFIPDYTQNSLRKEHERTKQTLTHFAKLERQQFGEDQPSNITSLRGLASFSKAHIFLQLAFYVASIDSSSGGSNITQLKIPI
jgi:hypothetical protein